MGKNGTVWGDYLYLSLIRWFKIFVAVCVWAAALYVFDGDSFKSDEPSGKATQCAPTDNIPAEDPINH